MSEEPKKRPRAWIWWALLALLILYPASAGPATRALDRANIDDRWLAIPYGPLRWAMENSGAFDAVFTAYLGLWVDLRTPAPNHQIRS